MQWKLWLAGIGAWKCSEWQNRRWSRQLVHPYMSGQVAVVLPGFRNPGRHINSINRWRVAIALRTLAAHPGGLLIVSGGVTTGTVSEARLLADYARTLGYRGEVILEEDSHSTWENVANVLPLAERFDAIAFASQPSHALKARAYAIRQRPDLEQKLIRADDYRLLEHPLTKMLLAIYGHRTLRGAV